MPLSSSQFREIATRLETEIGRVIVGQRDVIRHALVALFADGHLPAGLEAGWRVLAVRGHETVLLHLLTPEEHDPTLRGELELEDSETNLRRPLTLDQVTLRTYHRQREAWQAGLRALAARQRGRYVLLETAQPLRRMLLEQLRQAHVVK